MEEYLACTITTLYTNHQNQGQVLWKLPQRKNKLGKTSRKKRKLLHPSYKPQKLQTCHRDYQAGYRSTSMCIRVVTVISRSSFIPWKAPYPIVNTWLHAASCISKSLLVSASATCIIQEQELPLTKYSCMERRRERNQEMEEAALKSFGVCHWQRHKTKKTRFCKQTPLSKIVPIASQKDFRYNNMRVYTYLE